MENREKKSKPQIKLPTKSPHVAYFKPMLESFADHDELNEVIKNRVSKACDLLDGGVKLFPNDFQKEHPIAWIKEQYEGFSVEELEASIARDDYRHQGALPNNFARALPSACPALV